MKTALPSSQIPLKSVLFATDFSAASMRALPLCHRHGDAMSKDNRAAFHLSMSRIRPERPRPESTDRSVAADVLLRQEPDEEEDEEEDEGDRNEDDEDEDTNDGYSE